MGTSSVVLANYLLSSEYNSDITASYFARDISAGLYFMTILVRIIQPLEEYAQTIAVQNMTIMKPSNFTSEHEILNHKYKFVTKVTYLRHCIISERLRCNNE